MIARAILIATTCLLAACWVPIARFTVIGNPSATHTTSTVTTTRITGRSCRWWVAGVHFGVPHMDEALADALARAGTRFLRDAELVSIHPVYGLFGRHCYELTGTPWPVEAR